MEFALERGTGAGDVTVASNRSRVRSEQRLRFHHEFTT
jgi:hypothetical protein